MKLIEIDNFLKTEDVLLIVPPFASTLIPSFGLHLLQAICKEKKVTVSVLYANLFFSEQIGSDLYHSIFLDDYLLMGERLFAAVAFNLPPMKYSLEKRLDPDWIPDHMWQREKNISNEDIPPAVLKYRELFHSVDKDSLEALCTQWIKNIAKQIVKKGYSIVGCTTSSGSLSPTIALLKWIKKLDPNICTVIGGSMCDGEMAEGILSLDNNIDYIFSGESENTFAEFSKNYLDGHLPEEKIIYGEPVVNLDLLPLPQFHEYFEQGKRLEKAPNSFENSAMMLYETSRGCWYGKCSFCGLRAKKKSFRKKSPNKVIKDLKTLFSQYNKDSVWMIDNIMPQEYFKTLLPQISEELPSKKFSYEIKSNLTLDHMLTLKNAGITQLQPGIESLSTSLLKRMNKGVTAGENISLLRYARSLNIDVRWYLLFGLPYDQCTDYEEMLKLLPYIHHLRPPRDMIPLTIHRFSEYYTTPEKFGISNLQPAEVYHDVLPAHANFNQLVYQFAGKFNAESKENPELIKKLWKEFKNWQQKWEFYQSLPLDFLLPMLHVEKKSSGEFLLSDTRGIPGNPQSKIISSDEASLILINRPCDSESKFQWILDLKMGTIMDSWFIPFATANPNLLQEFEGEYSPKKSK